MLVGLIRYSDSKVQALLSKRRERDGMEDALWIVVFLQLNYAFGIWSETYCCLIWTVRAEVVGVGTW